LREDHVGFCKGGSVGASGSGGGRDADAVGGPEPAAEDVGIAVSAGGGDDDLCGFGLVSVYFRYVYLLDVPQVSSAGLDL